MTRLISYDAWKRNLQKVLESIEISDLPDASLRDYFEAGMSAEEAVSAAVLDGFWPQELEELALL